MGDVSSMLRRFMLIYVILVLLLGESVVASKTIDFSGYSWQVKNGYGGPGPNNWDNSAEAVFVDSDGLHLTVGVHEGKWYSSEVYLPQSLGYGTYEFEIASDVSLVDTNLVGAVFLYEDDTHEIDVEFSRWAGEVGNKNVQFVMQPFDVAGNMKRFMLNSGSGVMQKIIWEPKRVLFELVQNGLVMQQWGYTGQNNFVPGKEKVHINFWQYKGMAPSDLLKKEFIVKKFRFTALDPEEEICSLVKSKKGKGVEKGFFSMLAGKLKGYFS